ncbi:unnamed protein product [Fraxinus pennsylvanica]|uniref:Uncharacterized protein n=1 Tax=Fraxinus pennsylvanica TaxID=56036 RepID=A0AAD2E8D6_9LAMI|nr:unnamed protein product [Fraxinus pennsylvanica]
MYLILKVLIFSFIVFRGGSDSEELVDELNLFRYDDLNKLLLGDYASNKKAEEPSQISSKFKTLDTDNGFPDGQNLIRDAASQLDKPFFIGYSDLILFVISANRPLTESEVTFLRYVQQWKKRVVFVLNKSDLYQNAEEVEIIFFN